MKLSICIPTIIGREEQFKSLLDLVHSQINGCGLTQEVEVITACDNKEISIGKKRDNMYKECKGLYAVQIDDDDRIAENYIECVYLATLTGADCVGYMEQVIDRGRVKTSDHSIKYQRWEPLPKPIGGVHFRRTPFTKTPIKTDLCKRVGVKDMRFGEDHDFANRIRPYLKTEAYINGYMYFYDMPTYRNEAERRKRFGINDQT